MRKTLLVIAVLFTTAQVFAATVTLEVNDIGGGWASIRYSADANVSAFGLKVTADSGALFTGQIKDYNVGESTAGNLGYGIFPGTIDINEDTGVVDGNGTPVAPNDDPGAEGTGFGTGTLILEMGALYVEGNEPNLSGTLIKVQVDGDCNVCVEGEPIRGNIVLTDGTAVEANDCAYIQLVVDCFYVGLVDKCGQTVTAPQVATWESLGKPECWCWDCHCRGDVDDNGLINATDLLSADGTGGTDHNGWKDAWTYKATDYQPCCDTNYDGQINTTDLLGFDGAGGTLTDGWVDGWANKCN